MIALPHLIGAPHPVSQDSAVPAVLAAQFAANSLVTAAVFWVVLGALLGWACRGFTRELNRCPSKHGCGTQGCSPKNECAL